MGAMHTCNQRDQRHRPVGNTAGIGTVSAIIGGSYAHSVLEGYTDKT